MVKKTSKLAYSVGSMKDFSSFVDSLVDANMKKGDKVNVTLTDIKSLDLSSLRDLDEKLYLTGVKIELNVTGNVGVLSAALLSPQHKRRGFKGRSISLAIPSSLDAASKSLLEKRVVSFAKKGSESKMKDFVSKGVEISMDTAKELGLVDTIIDLSKKRGSNVGKAAVVASEGNPATENSTEIK